MVRFCTRTYARSPTPARPGRSQLPEGEDPPSDAVTYTANLGSGDADGLKSFRLFHPNEEPYGQPSEAYRRVRCQLYFRRLATLASWSSTLLNGVTEMTGYGLGMMHHSFPFEDFLLNKTS